MKVLVLGCGSIGKRHAQNALALSAEVAIFDIKTDISEALGSELELRILVPLTLLWHGKLTV